MNNKQHQSMAEEKAGLCPLSTQIDSSVRSPCCGALWHCQHALMTHPKAFAPVASAFLPDDSAYHQTDGAGNPDTIMNMTKHCYRLQGYSSMAAHHRTSDHYGVQAWSGWLSASSTVAQPPHILRYPASQRFNVMHRSQRPQVSWHGVSIIFSPMASKLKVLLPCVCVRRRPPLSRAR